MSFKIHRLTNEHLQTIKDCPEYDPGCPVSLDRLSLVSFTHFNFEGKEVQGQMIVLDQLAEAVGSIFKEIHAIEFPIHSALPIDQFNGDDVASMEANNSSAFNCRRVMNTDKWSSHAYGAAIDINPVQNPYVLIDDENATAKIYPSKGTGYLNRHVSERGMVEPIVAIFNKHGFTEWGGAWKSPLDYHHFQLPWNEIEGLVD